LGVSDKARICLGQTEIHSSQPLHLFFSNDRWIAIAFTSFLVNFRGKQFCSLFNFNIVLKRVLATIWKEFVKNSFL